MKVAAGAPRRHISVVLTACAAVVFGLAGCSSSKKTSAGTIGSATTTGATSGRTASATFPPIPPGPIRFGVSVPLSGATASYGLAYKAAYNVTLGLLQSAAPRRHRRPPHPVRRAR